MADAPSSGKMEIGPDLPIDQAIETAPVIVVDGAFSMATARGVTRFNLFQDLVTAQPGKAQEGFITRRICARIVMPAEAVKDFAKWLLANAEEQERLATKK